MLLSTPEHGAAPPGRAWRLYRRLGFRDVLRDHRFTGDSRPFAVLGRELPLPPDRAPRVPSTDRGMRHRAGPADGTMTPCRPPVTSRRRRARVGRC